MGLQIKLEGIEKVEALVKEADEHLGELKRTFLEIGRAMDGLNIKISQPKDGRQEGE